MHGDVQLLTARVPEQDASVRRARLKLESLPANLRVHPEANPVGIYNVGAAPPTPDQPLFDPRANRPRDQIEALFDLFETLRLTKMMDNRLSAKPIHEEFLAYVDAFSSVQLDPEQTIEYLPMYPRGQSEEYYRGWAFQPPRYLLYVGMFGGETV
jgi:hypothetical protein